MVASGAQEQSAKCGCSHQSSRDPFNNHGAVLLGKYKQAKSFSARCFFYRRRGTFFPGGLHASLVAFSVKIEPAPLRPAGLGLGYYFPENFWAILKVGKLLPTQDRFPT